MGISTHFKCTMCLFCIYAPIPLNANSSYETLLKKFTDYKLVLSECIWCDIDPIESYLRMLYNHQEPTDQRLESGANRSKTRSAINSAVWIVHAHNQSRYWVLLVSQKNCHEAMWHQLNKTALIDYLLEYTFEGLSKYHTTRKPYSTHMVILKYSLP